MSERICGCESGGVGEKGFGGKILSTHTLTVHRGFFSSIILELILLLPSSELLILRGRACPS
jgi:hypothetical protein